MDANLTGADLFGANLTAAKLTAGNIEFLEQEALSDFPEGTRNSILRVLKRQLDSVPDFVRQRLDAIQSIERLEEILDQALTVSSVDELALS